MRKRAIWIGGAAIFISAMVYATTRAPKDDFASLKSHVVKTEFSYYSAHDISENWENVGGTLPVPRLHNTSYKYIKLSAVPAKELFEVLDAVVKKRGFVATTTFSGTKRIRVYTQSGKEAFLGEAPSLTVSWFPTGLASGEKIPKLTPEEWVARKAVMNAWIFDSRDLTLWDELRVRANHYGRVPYVDPPY